jgi:hypothetical protein
MFPFFLHFQLLVLIIGLFKYPTPLAAYVNPPQRSFAEQGGEGEALSPYPHPLIVQFPTVPTFCQNFTLSDSPNGFLNSAACLGFMVLWFMIVFSLVLYQLRSIFSIRDLLLCRVCLLEGGGAKVGGSGSIGRESAAYYIKEEQEEVQEHYPKEKVKEKEPLKATSPENGQHSNPPTDEGGSADVQKFSRMFPNRLSASRPVYTPLTIRTDHQSITSQD